MKSSLFLAATSALLASAGPLRKRAIETDWVFEVVTVTVTAGQEPAAVPTAIFVEKPAPTPEYDAPPPPAAPVVTTTKAPAPPPPAPTTTTPEVKEPTSAPPQPTTTTQPDTGSKPPPTVNLGSYEQTMLDQHNVHRANHSAPALTWDSTLAQYAANTGNKCIFQHDMKQGNGGYGQNLAAWGGSGSIDDLKVKTAASGVTEQWYNGEFNSFQYYGQANPSSNFEDWGHFTQVVWKSSTKVGCATVKCGAGSVLSSQSWFTVCNYNPAGNFGGEYADNVAKPRGDATVTV